MTDDETDALAGEYVLGLLDVRERATFEGRLERDAALRARVVSWRDRLLPIDVTAPARPPSPALWPRIAAALPPERRTAARAGWWESLAFWRPFGLATAFASLLLAVGLAGQLGREPALPQLVAVMETPDGRPAAVVNAYADGRVQLVPIVAPEVPQGRILEIWTLQTRERGPVSIGRMDRARTLRLDLKGLSAAEVGHLFEVTLEPLGGSPTGRPTGPVLMKGLAAPRI